MNSIEAIVPLPRSSRTLYWRSRYRQGRLPDAIDKMLIRHHGESWIDYRSTPEGDRWELGFAALESFAAREGHAMVPAGHREADIRLGLWVRSRRAEYRNGRLTPARIKRLERLPGWLWDLPAESLQRTHAALDRFVANHGHARVPYAHVQDGINLGVWIAAQRYRHRKGELDPGEVSRLESISGWSWGTHDAKWEAAISALTTFTSANGTAFVPYDGRVGDYPLGVWAARCRTLYRQGKLPKEKVRQLEGFPGWIWDPSESEWRFNLAALESFTSREHHARVPDSHVEDGLKLGRWVTKLRARYKAGSLEPDRISYLECLPGWTWDALASRWQESIVALEEFTAREGHSRVPLGHIESGHRLGIWVGTRRSEYKTGRLTAAQIEALEKFKGWAWDANAALWADRTALLKLYVSREGHALVPQRHSEGGQHLGRWLNKVREQIKSGRLPSERIADLDAIDTSWRNGATAPWEAGQGRDRL